MAKLQREPFWDGISDEESLIQQYEKQKQILALQYAPVSIPGQFCEVMKQTGQAPARLMDFKKGTTTLVFKFGGGIIVAADSRASMGAYMSSAHVKKIISVNPYTLCTIAGGAADCAFWIRHLSKLCRLYELRNGERISVAAASNILTNIFFSYRAYNLCAGIMMAGWDKTGPQVYYIDDKGTRLNGNIFSAGSGSTYAYGIVDSLLNENLSIDEAVQLARYAIYHATLRDGGSGGVVRVYHIGPDGWTNMIAGENVSDIHYSVAKERGFGAGQV